MPNRLLVQSESHFPVQTFFNSIGDDSFVKMIDTLTNGVGYSINECDCTFPDDLDPDEEPFDGVRFSLFEESVIIDTDELKKHLKVVCDEFVKRHPETTEQINGFLGRL